MQPSAHNKESQMYKYDSSKVHLSKTCQMKSLAVLLKKKETQRYKEDVKTKIDMSERAADILQKTTYIHAQFFLFCFYAMEKEQG